MVPLERDVGRDKSFVTPRVPDLILVESHRPGVHEPTIPVDSTGLGHWGP